MVEYIGVYLCVALYSAGLFLLGAPVTACVFIFHVAAVPLLFRYSKTFRRNLVFANFVQWPPNIDFEKPSLCGIDGGRNLSIVHKSKVARCDVKIGIWHILPKTVYERLKGSFEMTTDKEELSRIMEDELVDSNTSIMLYCHGNSNSRGATHRIALYKFFQKMDFHTIAFDYRGYGDSTYLPPTEDGVVEDALAVYDWLIRKVDRNGKRPAIFVWGHSLGTGISSHFLGNLPQLSSAVLSRTSPLPLPNGLILEAPFNNLADEVEHMPMSELVRWLPYYESSFVAPFRSNPEQIFKSDEHLAKAKLLPVLVLHAKDDAIVPFRVGLKLYRSILHSRSASDAPVTLHTYDKRENLGHKWICHAQDLPEVIGEFVAAHK